MKDENRIKKIVLIGPVYPYKGGISHYTGLMCKSLGKMYDVTMVSFKFQYPKFLYKKEQKDFTNESFKIDDTNYWIHTANPFNWFYTAKRINEINPDLVIIQWWHPYFSPCYWGLAKLLHNFKIMFICHNVFPHESFPMDRLLTKNVLKQGNRFVVQSEKDAFDLQSIIHNPVFEKMVHPTYDIFKQQYLSKEQARQQLGVKQNEKVLLFFGFVREYKGLKYLINAMPELIGKIPNISLLIAGDFGNDKDHYIQLIQNNNVEEKINIYDGYTPDQEVEKYFAACDLVVLPYESATQSGIVQVAFGFEKPVVVTNVGGLPEVVSDGKTGYIVKSRDSHEIAKAIVNYFDKNRENEFRENIRKESYRFSWDRMVEIIGKLMR